MQRIKKIMVTFCRSTLLLSFSENRFRLLRFIKKVKFDEARGLSSTFLRLQGDHYCALRTKVVSFFMFFQELSNKKFKKLRPKMTKIASGGGGSCFKVAQT